MRYSGIAQLVEHLTVNQVVVSSSLTAGVYVKSIDTYGNRYFFILHNDIIAVINCLEF